jgi:hypothetical protein
MNAMDETSPNAPKQTPAESGPGTYGGAENLWLAWFFSWLGISLSGGLFGVVLGGLERDPGAIVGFVAGFLIAGIVSVPVILTIAALAWTFWLSRFQILFAVMSGACTGVISSAPIALAMLSTEATRFIILAGCIGGCGGGFAAYFFWASDDRRQQIGVNDEPLRWQFSLRDLFLRFTVLAVVIAAWSAILAKIVD